MEHEEGKPVGRVSCVGHGHVGQGLQQQVLGVIDGLYSVGDRKISKD